MTTNILDINSRCADGEAYVSSVDTAYGEQILNIAKDIFAHRNERPIILLSGPSGSGKTTSALMLEKLLDGWDCETHTLSMDNYFNPLTSEQKALAAQGKMDLESPGRVDIPFLNEQLAAIVDCRPVDIPKYNFAEAAREFSGWTLTRKPGELVILEGIHAMNPEVITIPDHETSRIYVSVRTRIKCGGVTLHPSKIRLLRRMTRDSLFRNRSFAETLSMFHNVERGERLYIAPYKDRATYNIDTFIEYELGVYKKLLLDQLEELGAIEELAELLQVMDSAAPVDDALVPPASLIREFIGNSQFSY